MKMKKVHVDYVLVSPAFGLVIDHFEAASILPRWLRKHRPARPRILRMGFCALEQGASPRQQPGFRAPSYSAEFQELADNWRVKKHSPNLPPSLGEAAVGSKMQAVASFATLCGSMLSCESLAKEHGEGKNHRCREHASALLSSPGAIGRSEIAKLPGRRARHMKQAGSTVWGVGPSLALTIDQFNDDGAPGNIEMKFCSLENKGAHPMGIRIVTRSLYAARLERVGGQWGVKETSLGLPKKLGGAVYGTQLQAVAAFVTLCGFLLSSRSMLNEPEHDEADARCWAHARSVLFGWSN